MSRDCGQSRELTTGCGVETGARRGRDDPENLYARTEPAPVPVAVDAGSSIGYCPAAAASAPGLGFPVHATARLAGAIPVPRNARRAPVVLAAAADTDTDTDSPALSRCGVVGFEVERLVGVGRAGAVGPA
jgi:hypothetical protein